MKISMSLEEDFSSKRDKTPDPILLANNLGNAPKATTPKMAYI